MREVPNIQDVDVAFGRIDHLPPVEDIPEEFKNHKETKWEMVIVQWFYRGLPSTTEFIPKEGVDPKQALRAIQAILGSYAPKHEHKIAGCSYLLSEWFEDVRIPEQKGETK